MVVQHVRERAMLFADLAESSSGIAVPCLRRSNDRAIVEILFSGRRRNSGAVAGSIARDFDSSGTLLLDAALTLDTKLLQDSRADRRTLSVENRNAECEIGRASCRERVCESV